VLAVNLIAEGPSGCQRWLRDEDASKHGSTLVAQPAGKTKQEGVSRAEKECLRKRMPAKGENVTLGENKNLVTRLGAAITELVAPPPPKSHRGRNYQGPLFWRKRFGVSSIFYISQNVNRVKEKFK
jgi:hypothetical protein